MKFTKAIVPAVFALALTACGTSHLSHDITPEGWVNGEVVFPDPADATLKGGIFPNPQSLKLLTTGVTKDQVYAALGRPHFREGVFGVREWDYVLHFRGTGASYATCQFKIVFSQDGHGQSFFPHPGLCGAALEDFEVTPEEADAIIAGADELPGSGHDEAPARREEISVDALFAFDSAEVKASGLVTLLQVARSIKAEGLRSITVEGHTDRIGSDAYNMDLSRRRAEAVRDVLVAADVAGDVRIQTFGKSVPKVLCADQPRQALISCLAPNRRVVVVASE